MLSITMIFLSIIGLRIVHLADGTTHNSLEFFIQPIGPRFMGHFYDRVPDNCFPSGESSHVVIVATGESSVKAVVDSIAHIAHLSRKGAFLTQIYFHFIVDKPNQLAMQAWRSNFEFVDGHRPRHRPKKNDNSGHDVPVNVCGVMHHFHHACSHARLGTEIPLMEEPEPPSEAESAYLADRCRHNYQNWIDYFKTEVSDLLDPPEYIILMYGWNPVLLNLTSLRNVYLSFSEDQRVGITLAPAAGVDDRSYMQCGVLHSENFLNNSSQESNYSSLCFPSDMVSVVSLREHPALSQMQQLVREQPLFTGHLNVLWNAFREKHFYIYPLFMLQYVVFNESLLKTEYIDWVRHSYRYTPPSDSDAVISGSGSSTQSPWCHLDGQKLPPHSTFIQWISKQGRYCHGINVFLNEKGTNGEKEPKEEALVAAPLQSDAINPSIAIVDNGPFGLCAAARLAELRYENWVLLTSVVTKRSPLELSNPDWLFGIEADHINGRAVVSNVNFFGGSQDRNYFDLLMDRLLRSELWRYDTFEEQTWKSNTWGDRNNQSKDEHSHSLKRRIMGFKEQTSLPPLHRQLRRPVVDYALRRKNNHSIWNVLLRHLDPDRIIGPKGREIPVSMLLPEAQSVLLGEDNMYSLGYDKLISGLPVKDFLSLLDGNESSENSDMPRVVILEFLYCGDLRLTKSMDLTCRNPPCRSPIVSSYVFPDDDVIFYKLVVDRRPFADEALQRIRSSNETSQSCDSKVMISKITVEIATSSKTIFVPTHEELLKEEVLKSLISIGFLSRDQAKSQIRHHYPAKRFAMEHVRSSDELKRLRLLSAANVHHFSLYYNLDEDAVHSQSYQYTKSMCNAGVQMVEEILFGDKVCERSGSSNCSKKMQFYQRSAAITAAHSKSNHTFLPASSGRILVDSPLPNMDIVSFRVHSPMASDSDGYVEKRTSKRHAGRIRELQAAENQRISAYEEALKDGFIRIAIDRESWRNYHINIFDIVIKNINSVDPVADSYALWDQLLDDGDYHVTRPKLNISLKLPFVKPTAASVPHLVNPSSLALFAHLSYVVERYDDLPDTVFFAEPTLPTDNWFYGSNPENPVEVPEELKAGLLASQLKISPHLGVYGDVFEQSTLDLHEILTKVKDDSDQFTITDNSFLRNFCRQHNATSSPAICRKHRPYFYYASKALIRRYTKGFYEQLLNDAKIVMLSGDENGVDVSYLIVALAIGLFRDCATANLFEFEVTVDLKKWLQAETRMLAPYPPNWRHTDCSLGAKFVLYPLLLQSSRVKMSELLYDDIFGAHMQHTPRPLIRNDDMAELQSRGLVVYVYHLNPRFHRNWLEMGSTILCWQDHPWDRSPCDFLKGPLRSRWPRQRIVCFDGDITLKIDTPTSSSNSSESDTRNCRVLDMEPSEHARFKTSYNLSPYRTTDPAGEVVILMRLLLALRHVTVTSDPARADLFLMPYLAGISTFVSRNVKASPDLTDGPFPLPVLLETFRYLNPLTQKKHLLLSSSECVRCIRASPDCVCCDNRKEEPHDFSWDWQTCSPHTLEELYPELIRFTLGPRRHSDKQHFIVPSLILDADAQPGDMEGGGSDYSVETEAADLAEQEAKGNEFDVYITNGDDYASMDAKRPLFLSVFTTFHPNLHSVFANAMNTRERLVVSILTHLRRHGHAINTTNLVDYAHLFEVTEANKSSNCATGLSGNDMSPSSQKSLSVLIHVGDLRAKPTFPSRRTFYHAYRKSVFCPIPPGDVPHGSRFFHAVLCGCIPVVLLWSASIPGYTSWHMNDGAPYIDSYPFIDTIDYERIVIQIPGENIDRLIDILRQIPDDVLREKRAYMLEVRNYFINDYSGSTRDSFSLTLQEILKRL